MHPPRSIRKVEDLGLPVTEIVPTAPKQSGLEAVANTPGTGAQAGFM